MASTSLSEMKSEKTPRRLARILSGMLKRLIAGVLLLLTGAGAWVYWRIQVCLPQLEGTVQVPGLSARVEVLRDSLGVPHLRAQSLEDLLFAQGYVTAQDRLWQMDTGRRAAEGELAEVFGERALRLDIENRTLGFRQAMERAVRDLDPESRKFLSAYGRGINAFIASHLGRLPIEFLLLGYQPRPWSDLDSFAIAVNMSKMLSTTWRDKLMREHVRAKIPPELYAELFPDHSPYDVPVAEEVQGSEVGARGSGTRTRDGEAILASTFSPLEPGSLGGLGSNNWVLSGAHTLSGKPLLANDPHLPHSVPSVWYMIHLKAPGLDVSGVSLPGLPLIIIGHNERIAWGVTNTGPDVQDLYVESFNFRDPKKYLHNKNWVDAEERAELIKIRGERDFHLLVKVTRHGPVISHDRDRELALRWTALDTHALGFPFLKIDQARDWREFTAALSQYSGPTQNFVYADLDGNIGFYAAGWIPVRKQGDGSIPVPGDVDDYDWTGYIPFESLPHAYNPASGIIVTANGRIVPDRYPYFVTHKWEAPFRTARINQLLSAGTGARPCGSLKSCFTVADMLRIQTDIHAVEDDWLREQLLNAAAARPPQTPDARYALGLLRAWDAEARADSAAILVCEASRHALLERIVKPKLGEDLSGYRWPMSTIFLENVLTNPASPWRPPEDPDWNATLTASLEEGVRRIPRFVHSSSHNAWKWGQTIPLTFRHPLSVGSPLLRRLFDVGPFPQSGTGTTVKQTTSEIGPSMRMVVDFSDFENSVQNLTLGESGQALSPYYRDQLDAWSSSSSFPMLFSDPAVDKAATHKLVLEPRAGP
jgi:penicillin amidase